MELQRIRVKLYADAPADLDVAPLLDIFSRWRTRTDHPAGWIDLADYAHVPEGPWALLVGRLGNLGYEMDDGRPGLVWRNKAGLEGSLEQRVAEAVRRGLGIIATLVAEPGFPEGIRLLTDRLAVDVVDRVTAPHTGETESVVGPAVAAVLDRLYGRAGWEATRHSDAGRALGYDVRAASAPPLEELAKRLSGGPMRSVREEEAPMAPNRVSAREAARLMDEEGYVYLDVRSLGEFADGHPAGAYNVPILIETPMGHGLAPNPSFLDVARANFEPDTPIVVGCRSHGRSERAMQVLLANGFSNLVINLGGFDASMGPAGMEPGWSRLGLPISETPEPGHSWEELRGKARK